MEKIYRKKIGNVNYWTSIDKVEDNAYFWQAGTGVRKMVVSMSGIMNHAEYMKMLDTMLAKGYALASK